MIKKILFFFSLILIINETNAQLINVNSSSSSPAAPLECNDLFITVNGVANCINFQYDSIGYTVTGSSIDVGVYYTGGLICAGALSPFQYTVNLGNVPAGTYSVTIKGFLNLAVDDNLSAPNITIASCCPVDASFTSSATVGCTDDTAPIIFTSTSTSAITNNWYVNDVLSFSGTSFSTPVPPVGTYIVKLVSSDGTCSDSITQTYQVHNSPTLVLGPDTAGCAGTPIVLSAPTGFNTYAWTNSSSTTANATVTTANTYVATVTDANGCTATDSIVVDFNPLPSVSLGNDTSICAGDIFVLDAGFFSTYNWNTAETTQTITVTNSFNYSVTVTDANGCQKNDNISVLVNNLPSVNLGFDTIEICAGNTATLNAGNFSTYLWSTAETTNSVSVATEGAVSVMVTDANNCSNSDETYIKVNDLPIVDFGSDTLAFCAGSSLTLNPGTFNTYAWSTGASSSSLNVNTTGSISVTVTDSKSCMNSGSVYAKQNANPIVNLGEDQELCTTDKLTLTAGTYSSYLWNDGSTLATLEVNGADFTLGNNSFDVEVIDNNGCIGTDEVIVNVKECNVAISSVALENSISIFPIPAVNVLNIKSENNSSAQVRIFNILGKEVFRATEQKLNTSIDVSKFNEGIYFIEISVKNERLVKQFLKVK